MTDINYNRNRILTMDTPKPGDKEHEDPKKKDTLAEPGGYGVEEYVNDQPELQPGEREDNEE